MNKRGQITQTQIIYIIMAIVGLVVVLILLYTFELDKYSDDEACRLSVLSRATAPSDAATLIPLKCTTKKICITMDGQCSQFNGLSSDEIETIKLTGDPAKDGNTISMISAESKYDCWEMMGEGKLDLFRGGKSSDFPVINNLYSAQTTCFICSRIALDTDFVNSNYFDKVNDYIDVNGYLENYGPKGVDKTYVRIFSDGKVVGAYTPKDSQYGEKPTSGEFVKSNEIAYVYFQILTPDSATDKAVKTGLLAGGGVYFAGSSIPLIGKFSPSLIAGAASTAVVTGGIAYLQQDAARELSASRCENYAGSNEAAKNGCTLLIPVDYNNVNLINSYCSRIEGNP